MFWIAAALLTLGAGLAVLLPLTARRGPGGTDAAQDFAVYRDQLAELERDKARGLIPADAAAEARAEIGRRLLRADASEEATPDGDAGRAHRLVAVGAVLMVPALSWSLYGALGSPDLPSQPLSARLSQDPGKSTVEELVARAEAQLHAAPEDGRGWSVLAPIYLRMGRYEAAAAAFRNAIRLAGATADREAGLGEALAAVAGGAVAGEAKAAFERALKLEPGHPLSRFQLAAATAQAGRPEQAEAAWNAMLADLPKNSPWRGVIAQAVAGLRAAGKPPGGGPGAAEIAAAESMSGADRTAMIESMVAGLDEKLRADPSNGEGWMRLVRSYLVLDKPDAARDALSRGRAALGAESEEGRKLVAFAASLGLTEASQP